MPDERTVTLFSRLRDSGLLEPPQLEELARLPESSDPDPRALGRVLLKRGWLTRFQINQAAQGRAKDLVIGPYLVLDRLGEGGMGQVYKARHRHMQRTVALKLIRKERLGSEDAVRRFYQEVQAAAQLHHPNVVTAYDAGPAGNAHYFAMELVEGTDLARLVRESGPLPAGQACEYVRQAALGLEHAHERGLVHRDVKPANLLVGRDAAGAPVVKILDLGLARSHIPDGRQKALTQTGQVIGTPDYLAPEQALDSRAADTRSDLYSLGCTLYYLLTGRPPFVGESLAKVLLQHQMEDVQPPPGGWGGVPAAVQKVLHKLMAKRPEDRYQTPREVAEDLAPFCGAEVVDAIPVHDATRAGEASAPDWSTLAGERAGAGKRPPRAKNGEATEVVRAGRGTKEAPVARDNRKLLLIAGGIGLGVGLALALVVVIVLLLTRERPPASPATGEVAQATKPPGPAADGGERVQKDAGAAKRPEPPAAAPGRPPDAVAGAKQQAGPVVAGPPTGAPPRRTPRQPPTDVPQPPPDPPPPPIPPWYPPGPSQLERLREEKVDARDRSAVPLKLPVVAVLPGQADALTGVAFSPNGGLLATTCRDGTARLWDLARPEPEKLLEVRERPGPAGSPAFSPAGTTLAFASGDGATVYDVAGVTPARRGFLPGCTMSVAPGDNPCPEQILAFFPDGKMLCVSHLEPFERSNNKNLHCCFKFWSLARWEPRLANTYRGGPSTPEQPADIHCLAIAPDFCLAFGGERKTLSWTKLDRLGNSRSSIGYGGHEDALVGMLFSPDGTTLAMAGRDGYVRGVMDKPQPGRFTRLMVPIGPVKAHDGWAAVVDFASDGKTFITSGEDRFVVWWNPAQRPPKIREWQAPAGTRLWRFSPDGRFAALSIPDERLALVRLSAPFQLP